MRLASSKLVGLGLYRDLMMRLGKLRGFDIKKSRISCMGSYVSDIYRDRRQDVALEMERN